MKFKKFVLLYSAFILLAGCSSKKTESELAELKNKNDLLQKENENLKNQIDLLNNTLESLQNEKNDLQNQVDELSSAKADLNDKSKFETHDLSLTLDFKYNGYDTKVYDLPEKNNEVYTIQTGDKVEVLKFVHVNENDKNFIKVEVSNGQEGFIAISGNPYRNGNFESAGTIDLDDAAIPVLKMEKSFEIYEGTNIKEQPSKASNNLHEITHKEGSEFYNTSLITADYKWVKIQVKDFNGWVPSTQLSVERGGPILDTPEEYIEFDLIGGNEI